MVSGSFNSPSGVLFTFPSRYLYTIGRQRVFSLGRWSSRIPAGFPVSRGTRELLSGSLHVFVYGTITLFGRTFQTAQLTYRFITPRSVCTRIRNSPTTPLAQRVQAWHANGFGSFHFARRYSGNRVFFLFLEVLRCFSSLRSPHSAYVFSRW
jgi:hypothetical protein